MLKWRSAELRCGGLAELADADGSKSSDRKVMGVQVPRPLPSPSIPIPPTHRDLSFGIDHGQDVVGVTTVSASPVGRSLSFAKALIRH